MLTCRCSSPHSVPAIGNLASTSLWRSSRSRSRHTEPPLNFNSGRDIPRLGFRVGKNEHRPESKINSEGALDRIWTATPFGGYAEIAAFPCAAVTDFETQHRHRANGRSGAAV